MGRVFERIDNNYVEDIGFGAWLRADEELRIWMPDQPDNKVGDHEETLRLG